MPFLFFWLIFLPVINFLIVHTLGTMYVLVPFTWGFSLWGLSAVTYPPSRYRLPFPTSNFSSQHGTTALLSAGIWFSRLVAQKWLHQYVCLWLPRNKHLLALTAFLLGACFTVCQGRGRNGGRSLMAGRGCSGCWVRWSKGRGRRQKQDEREGLKKF